MADKEDARIDIVHTRYKDYTSTGRINKCSKVEWSNKFDF